MTAVAPEKQAQPASKDDPKPRSEAGEKQQASDVGKSGGVRRSSADTGCKKYFPQIGDLVSVPCPR